MNLSIDQWITIVSAILGGLVGGLFTYIGVKTTLIDGWRKESVEREKLRKENILKIISNRPELEVVKVETIQSINTEVDFVPIIKYIVTEQDFRSVFKKNIISNLRERINIKISNIGKTNIDEIVLNIQDVKNTILLDNVYSRENDIKKGYVNFTKIINTGLKTEKSTYLIINFYGQCVNNVFYLLFKDINGFYWKQEIILYYYGGKDVKITVPKLISPYEYEESISNKDLINYILYKSYNNYEQDPRFEYQGTKNIIIAKEFENYLNQRNELTDKKFKFDEKYNFKNFNLYD
ncbi:MAG: hypothetical protein WCR30_04920 [Clostridia bacterium]